MPSEDEIADLKALITVARKMPVNVGLCLGKKPADSIVKIDRKRAPEALMREAKKEGETAKVAAGTLTIEGRSGVFHCVTAPPSGLGKSLRAFFKAIGINFDLEIIKPDGQAEGEEDDAEEPTTAPSPTAPGPTAPSPTAPSPTAPGAPPSSSPSSGPSPEAPPSGPDPRAVAEQLKSLKAAITDIGGKMAETMLAALGKIVDLLKTGKVAEASSAAEKLAQAVEKAKSAAAGAPKPTAEADKYGPAVAKLQGLVDALPQGDARAALTALLDQARAGLAKGDTGPLQANAKRVQDGLALQAAIDRLSPVVANALSKGLVAEPDKLRLLFNTVAENVPAPDHAKAMTALDRIEKLIAAGGKDPARDIPTDVQPFAKSRIEWGGSRKSMLTEVSRLQDAIRARCEEVGGLDEVVASLADLMAPLEAIDTKLEDKLDEIVGSPAGQTRDKLKTEARALIRLYQAELAKPFFAEVDAANGFLNVSVTATATAALAKVEAVLAA
ncbi:hypothetical protein NX862_14245 [Rhodobacter sp. KR11]|uniref:hypothetical protein n=1 Tax=Rhodobacter sp. KR11 TaxID=2974588 RepID=UPI00222324E5|nr:hypothetical protein [Rhodobacter sp. KR11]MCW1919917.1 hypothetical protein [Rhodobacter sp. KR11]